MLSSELKTFLANLIVSIYSFQIAGGKLEISSNIYWNSIFFQ